MSTFNYRTLCEIHLRHAYFLDNGQDDFDAMDGVQQQQSLDRFHYTEAIDIVPTTATAAALQGRRIVINTDGRKLMLRARTLDNSLKPVTGLEKDLVLVFALRIRHTRFAYFTDLTLDDPNRILLFANKQPSELATEVPLIPLEAEATRANDDYLLSADDSLEILKKRFRDDDRYGLLGLVYLRVEGNTLAYSLVEDNGETRATPPQFKIHFNTTSTYWKYVRPSADFMAETKTALPLTRHGFIEIDPATDLELVDNNDPIPEAALGYAYPNPLLESFEITPTKTYSVIFI